MIITNVNNSSIKERYGRFFIPSSIIDDPNNRHILRLLFSKIIVVRAEFLYCRMGIEYQAISEEFDEIEEYSETPIYNVKYDNEKNELSFLKEDIVPNKIQERLSRI
jgi:hypothetical protein